MYTYPHTIENGNGESLTFLKRVNDGEEDYLEVENVVMPNIGPPMHVHFHQSEGFTIKKGKIGIQILGEVTKYFTAGESYTFEPNVPHRFWNAGDEPLEWSGFIKPAHNIEYFLTEIFKTTAENGGKRPGMFEGAYLSRRYRSEFEMLEIPKFIKNVVFPAVVGIGKLLGKYKKYENAPEPVRK